MIDITTFSRLVSMVYDAAVRPSLWGATVHEIHRAFDAAGGGLVIAGSGDRSIVVTNVDPDSTRSYNAHYFRLDYVLAEVEAGRVGDVRTGTELIEPRRDSEFHTDWVRGAGAEDGLFVRLTPGRDPATLALVSPRRPTPYGSTEQVKSLQLLVPHLRRAIAIQRTLPDSAAQDIEPSAVLELMNHAALIVERECQVVSTNATAIAMVRQHDGLGITAGGRLVTTTAAGDNSLGQTVRRALPDAASMPACGGTLLCRRPSGRRSYLVYVAPLAASGLVDSSAKRTALVVVVDPEHIPEPPSTVLRNLYELTATEADIAMRVTRADELKTIAADLNVSITTVRTHLQHIFTKTETHRQAELVRLLSTFGR
jgi:DNA-binding CsgD family transcriptional regulator